MINYYLKIAYRILLKNRVYSILSIVGLSTAIFIAFFLFAEVNRMLGYDRCHTNHKEVFRVISNFRNYDNFKQPLTPWVLAPTMLQSFPEVEKVARYTILTGMLAKVSVKKGNVYIDEASFYCADKELFDILTLPILSMESNDFLSEPDFVVISKEMAIKYFNDPDPIGSMLEVRTMGKIRQFRVSAIMENLPENSTFQADFIASNELYLDMLQRYYTIEKSKQSWDTEQFNLLVQLKKGIPKSVTDKNLEELLAGIEGLEHTEYYLQNLSDVYLHSHDVTNDFIDKGEVSMVYVFSGIAVLILLIASINYVILTTARLSFRYKEIGIKKVFGIKKSVILIQIIVESTFIALLSLAIALLMVFAFKDHSDLLLMNIVQFNMGDTAMTVLLFILLACLIGILSGLYISLQVFFLNPVELLKGKVVQQGSKMDFKKVLIGLQLIIFVVLLIYASFIFKQVRYALSADLGFDPNNLVVVHLDLDYFTDYEVYVNSLRSHSGILSISGSSVAPPSNVASYSKYARRDDSGIEVTFESYLIDYDFFKTLGIKVLEGRTFSRDFPTDINSAIIINRKSVEDFGIEDPIGKKIGQFRIIGVVDNFNVHSFHEEILPSIFTMNPFKIRNVIVRIRPDDQESTIKFLEDKWQELAPGLPFNFFLVKPELHNFYKGERNFGKIISIYTLISILISILGLFGLSLFVAKRKTKEICIRKVHGASLMDIIKLLSKEYMIIVAIANLIAWPVAYLLVDHWLQSFEIRISILNHFWIFLLAAVLSACIVLITVGIKAVEASLKNTVDNLKYE